MLLIFRRGRMMMFIIFIIFIEVLSAEWCTNMRDLREVVVGVRLNVRDLLAGVRSTFR
jgi:hypothetical protein